LGVLIVLNVVPGLLVAQQVNDSTTVHEDFNQFVEPQKIVSIDESTDDDAILVSNVFFESDLRQALKDLSEEAGVPIIPDNTVQGYVTLEFEDAPLEQVLTKMLSGGGFVFKKIDDYYLVGAPVPENPSFPLLTETVFYKPNYLHAEQIVMLLSEYEKRFVRSEMKSNIISITAPLAMISKIRENIENVDIPPKQISIEAIVTELSNDAIKSLGLDWDWFGESGGKTVNVRSNMGSMINDTSVVGRIIRNAVSYKSFTYDLILDIKALATSGKARIRANPKITAINGNEATIFIGSERYFSIVTGPVNYPYTRLEQIPAGITLKILPRVSSKNEITAHIDCEVSEVTEIGVSGLPLVTKRTASTDIRVMDGEIIAIGGLVQERTGTMQKKVPLLGDIPLLGYAFSHTKNQKVETEIAIFIAPHILVDENSVSREDAR
jgi:type IV pilus assembly protein PilQ